MNDVLALLILLVLSGCFVACETALTAVSEARVRAFLAERRAGAGSLRRLKSNTNRTLIAILIGHSLANIAASAMATVIATAWFGHIGPGIAVGVLTIVILVFGEVVPKSFAARHAGSIALFVAPPLLLFAWLTLPLNWMLEQLSVRLQGFVKVDREPTVTESELLNMAEYGAQAGTIERDEQKMIERLFAFHNLRAGDVMIPRHQVFLQDGERTIADALPEIVARGYGRIPLISTKEEAINQIAQLRDVLGEVVKGNLNKPLKEVAHDTPLYSPLNQPISELFYTLRENERQMVVVVDEYGGLEGVFTLEDMLEELVGEIHDERYRPERRAQQVGAAELVIDGAEELRVVQESLDVALHGKPTDPVSLWILNHTEYIPAIGERFSIDGLQVVVEKASRRRIKQVRISRPARAGTQAEASPPDREAERKGASEAEDSVRSGGNAL